MFTTRLGEDVWNFFQAKLADWRTGDVRIFWGSTCSPFTLNNQILMEQICSNSKTMLKYPKKWKPTKNLLPRKLTWNMKIIPLKRKASSKPPFLGSMLVFRGVYQTQGSKWFETCLFSLAQAFWKSQVVFFFPAGCVVSREFLSKEKTVETTSDMYE